MMSRRTPVRGCIIGSQSDGFVLRFIVGLNPRRRAERKLPTLLQLAFSSETNKPEYRGAVLAFIDRNGCKEPPAVRKTRAIEP